MNSYPFTMTSMIASLFLIAGLQVEGHAQTNKSNISTDIPATAIRAFDTQQLKFRTDLVGSKSARQLELTVDFSSIDKLYDIQRVNVLVEFFRGGKSIGTQSFDLATENMAAVKDRQKIKHDFPLPKKYQGPDITIKGIQITAPAFSDYKYVYQENPTQKPSA